MTRAGKYVFTANTGSGTISRLAGTGSHILLDNPVAASLSAGGSPSDIDAEDGVLGVIDRGAGQSHLSLFSYNRFGELTPSGPPITLKAGYRQRTSDHGAGRLEPELTVAKREAIGGLSSRPENERLAVAASPLMPGFAAFACTPLTAILTCGRLTGEGATSERCAAASSSLGVRRIAVHRSDPSEQWPFSE